MHEPDRSQASLDAAPRREMWQRLQRRTTLGLTAAHLAGAVTTFVFLGVVVPVPSEVAYDWTLVLVNLAVFVPYVAVATVAGIHWGRRIGAPPRDWFVAGRVPDPHERALALRQPIDQLKIPAGIWAGAAVIFTALNAFFSLSLAALIAVTIGLGGLSTCALTYLIAERLGRELTAAALAGGVPEKPVGPGVATRVVLAWVLAAGIPLGGGVLLALAILAGANVSAEHLAATVLFLDLLGVSFGFLAMRIAARSIADPVESVRRALREVQAGNLDAEVDVYDGSEIGLLQAGFNRMASGLRERERLRDLFGRHVGTEVADRALERGMDLRGEVRECAALYVDVVGSTRLGATRAASEVVALLNRFFAVVVDVVHAHGGWVNKFEGDAALCVFGAPGEADAAATHALAAARELDRRLRDEVTELRAAIGVSWGSVVAGNVGAAARYEYTVIGDPVNEAARLSELAKAEDARILGSDAAITAADPEEAVHWRLGEPVTLRGRTDPTRIARPDVRARHGASGRDTV